MVDLIDETVEEGPSPPKNILMRIYQWTKYIWPLVIVIDIALQASQTPHRSPGYRDFLGKVLSKICPIFPLISLTANFELGITFIFDLEILWRFLAYTPNWRLFWASRANFLDLFLAIMCSVIQLPPIRQAAFASWLTFFQLARFYRVIMVFPRMRPLIVGTRLRISHI
jgi:hypothetical protein